MKNYLFIVLIFFGASCIEPYDFEAIGTQEVLVVEATLTDQGGENFVKLSTSIGLTDSVQNPVRNATVWTEDNTGSTIYFNESQPGLYEPDPLAAGVAGKIYTLYITTSDGTQYKSNAEILLPPTPIDSVYGEFKVFPSTESGTTSRGVQFFLGASKNTSTDASYYRYQIEQDYAIQVPYASAYKWDENQLMYFARDTLINVCYQHIPSTGILITTTSGQTENRVTELPLVLVEESDPYLLSKYSLITRQYTISPEAHQYYKTLKETNEASGSFFDQQKGSPIGNMTSLKDSSKPVLGYFEVAGVATDTSIFSPSSWSQEGYNPERVFNEGCGYDNVADTVLLEDMLLGLVNMSYRNMYYITTSGTSVVLVPKKCSDCRLYGTIKKPEFWD